MFFSTVGKNRWGSSNSSYNLQRFCLCNWNVSQLGIAVWKYLQKYRGTGNPSEFGNVSSNFDAGRKQLYSGPCFVEVVNRTSTLRWVRVWTNSFLQKYWEWDTRTSSREKNCFPKRGSNADGGIFLIFGSASNKHFKSRFPTIKYVVRDLNPTYANPIVFLVRRSDIRYGTGIRWNIGTFRNGMLPSYSSRDRCFWPPGSGSISRRYGSGSLFWNNAVK